MSNRQTGKPDEQSRNTLIGRATLGVERLRKDAMAIEEEFADRLDITAPAFRASARNLAHYLAVRRVDIRILQRELGSLGLSSLGRMEAHVMATLDSVVDALCLLRKGSTTEHLQVPPTILFQEGTEVLAENANAILGALPAERKTRIMVTMPSEAADDPAFVSRLLEQGMNIMRINCAHDSAEVWERMVEHLRQAEKAFGRSCKVCCDLAGPKLRTGDVESAIGVIKWKPQRNALGQTIAPAVVRFVRESSEEITEGTIVPVRGDLLASARVGDLIELYDARGRARSLEVIEASGDSCLCQAIRTAYVTAGTELSLRRHRKVVANAIIGTLPLRPQAIDLKPGDTLEVVRGAIPGRNAVVDGVGAVSEAALIGCSLDEAFSSVREGERIFLDDGKIAGTIRKVTPDRFSVEVTYAAGGAAKLHAEKGINLPDTDLKLPALSPADLEALEFVAGHADMVAMSFVQRPRDIEELIVELDRRDASHLGIVLKIETQKAFSRLPSLLFAVMRHSTAAVMVARGDLGVEVGFERLAEVQEEILWLCEAAHIPVIWATQVLESLAKRGMPSRAEVTDAAMGTRAECVMLNKGPYIMQALEFLRDVLNRMETHHEKKTVMLRRLSISESSPAKWCLSP
ncbi:pyruvate kinase [Candidatus Accumulibacter sp. ACC003]|uniref:pyruvate kinase n=1 Tax=Candidatus Accumulibacter sp. ACC003 TaxID=2823334 RepID=UPI0025C62F40|nr:pyruvate kinase [Candidatus Accumulibacter sp. ACC003]